MSSDILYPVKAVAMRTGLSPHVLRIWERRHGAVTPRRSGANRRLYTAEEVARLILLKKAVDAGHAIGRIARLDDAVLAKLEQDLQRAAVGLSGPVLIGEVVLPLVERIGDLWQSGDLRIAQEHVATGEIRYFLSGLLHRQRVREGAPQLVVATPCGQAHELGALLVAVVAASLGWKVTYLGADLPAEEIAAVASSARAQGVALSLVYPAGDPAVAGELTRLRSFLPDSAAILLGGRAAAGYLHMIESSGFTRIESIAELPEILARIQERKK
jgi:DNA-binding transcriptional MerR regulator/methylmalonyl-CoA mutase cobalamin-binding subunit